jgi:hypothetical protein
MKKAAAIFACLLVISCGGDKKSVINVKPLENAIVLELAFGDKDVPDEFLLASPSRVLVNYNGDIIVPDEYKLKIFDTDGRPKKIVGRRGQGPGEFSYAPYPYISEDRYIAVSDVMRPGFQIFGSQYELIEQKDINKSKLIEKLKADFKCEYIEYSTMYTYNDKTDILIGSGYSVSKDKPEISIRVYSIVKTRGDECSIIYKSEEVTSPDNITVYQAGTYLYTMLTDYRIAYSYPKEHKTFEDGKWYYRIIVHNFKTGEQYEIKKQYTPLAIPDSIIHRKIDYSKYPSDLPSEFVADLKEGQKKRSEALEKLKYYAPIRQLAADGDYIFAYTYQYDKDKKYVADVFKSSEGKYICSVYLPYMFTDFKDGYAYRIKSSADEYPQVEKYRIDPKVYGK